MAAHLAQIERVNPKVNAIVTLVAERAMADAARADEAQAGVPDARSLRVGVEARGGPLGVLHGVPVAHKDLVDTAGIRTTRGSPFYRDMVPTRDALIITRIRAAGALTLGKTNTPELGAGSQTFNTIFGATRNPSDVTKTCGGSSGGAAVALACGMVPIADGSDTGGSLRNPAAFCPGVPAARLVRGGVERRRPAALVTVPYPTQIAGTPMTTYIDWMRSCWYVTFMANPAISVPGGFTAAGLPVGVQIVGRHRDEWSVLQLAHAFEQATRHGRRRPALIASPRAPKKCARFFQSIRFEPNRRA